MTIRLYMTMSVDGYIAGPDDRPGQELGVHGFRLFNWLDDWKTDEVNSRIHREVMATGAVLSGRRTFELAGRWHGDHHDGVPIHILTHTPEAPSGRTTFHTDVDECAAAARASAGDKVVMVHGAAAAQALLAAGQLDELELHVVPVLLGNGRRLFDPEVFGRIELERVRVLVGPGVTHLRYRVIHSEEK